jgi:hypothetical protein
VEVKLGVGAVAVDDHASHVEIVALKEVGGARVVARDGSTALADTSTSS